MAYSIKELLLTIQGEGSHAGRSCVLVRFAGCNLWSGREQDRKDGSCSAWCDTDFAGTDGDGGGRFESAERLVAAIKRSWSATGSAVRPFVLLTGGEPLLQLDDELCGALLSSGAQLAVETNGSVPHRCDLRPIWVALSPKPGAKVLLSRCDELKLVYPVEGIEPEHWAKFPALCHYLQPRWADDEAVQRENTLACLRYCSQHPDWHLSLQLHKLVGVP
ncbi:MAG: 7-carboxy-7-deazaguanine synthase [Dehalococcoidia bacterium]